jgi:hypothetical protein
MANINARIIARNGLAAKIPPLEVGELAYDSDTRTLRIGEGGTVAASVVSNRSTSYFDLSNATFLFDDINLKAIDSTVGGVTISKLNTSNGLLARYGNDGFKSVNVIGGDGTLLVLGGDASSTSIDIRLSAALKAKIDAIVPVTSNTVITDNSTILGNGAEASPIRVPSADFTVAGVAKIASVTTLDAGVSYDYVVTPAALNNLSAGSALATSLRSKIGGLAAVTTTPALTGSGTTLSPLDVVAASTAQKGAVIFADTAATNAATDNTKAITPFGLLSLAFDSPLAKSFKRSNANNANLASVALTTDGQVHTFDPTWHNTLTYSLTAKLDAGHNAYATSYFPTLEVQLWMNIGGSWAMQDNMIIRSQGGGSGTAANLASFKYPQVSENWKEGVIYWTPRFATGLVLASTGISTSGAWNGQIRFNTVIANGGNPSALTVNTFKANVIAF